jgi:hypothetical protein
MLASREFKILRQRLGTVSEVAALFGVSERTIGRYERGDSRIPDDVEHALKAHQTTPPILQHNHSGNCFRKSYVCHVCIPEYCDVCHDHDQPRGECSECEPCEALGCRA